jgi:GNAT superfamily N-acetyltransferase
VRLRYRGKGVGAALLEDAVKEARKKGAESLEFAEDHASEFFFFLSSCCCSMACGRVCMC